MWTAKREQSLQRCGKLDVSAAVEKTGSDFYRLALDSCGGRRSGV